MLVFNSPLKFLSLAAPRMRLAALVLVCAVPFAVSCFAQETTQTRPDPIVAQPSTAPQPSDAASPQQQTPSPAQDAAPAQPAQDQAAPVQSVPAQSGQAQAGEAPATIMPSPSMQVAPGSASSAPITEDQLRQLLVGKDLFLRGGYLGDAITFNEHGRLNGHAPYGSYTLCGVRIDKVHLTKHKVELIGARYGLHFLGALPYEDPTKAVDRVKITPKKKVLKLTIDREVVVKAKKVKEAKPAKGKTAKAATGAAAAATTKSPATQAGAQTTAPSDAKQLNAEIAAAPADDKPADPKSVTTTTFPAHANRVLMEAINNVFAESIDERMIASIPKFWRLYYQAAAAKTDYRPADPAVLSQSMVDQKAKLQTKFEPGSNEYAQAAGVAGMALYHVVVGADGKPGEIAVARPIGFGLDENAVESIRKASFDPAMKDGKPVPVLLDLVVQFRIYSKRTAVTGTPETAEEAAKPKLPGPYNALHPQD